MSTETVLRAYLYLEHEWPPETLAFLWDCARKDHPQSLMWRAGTPDSLNGWIQWFSPRIVIFPVEHLADSKPTVENILGMAWVDEIDHPRGVAHFWFRKQGFCRKLLFASAQALELGFSKLQFQVLGCRPNAENKVSVKFARKLGFQMLGEIPLWHGHGETRYPASIGYLTAEMWQEKRKDYALS